MSAKIKFPTEKEKAEELILDYALDNNMYSVIQAFTAKDPHYLLAYRGSTIPDGRIFSPTIRAIVEREDVQHFYKVIRMMKLMYGKHPETVPIRKFSKIMIVLKMKVMLYDISKEYQLNRLLSKLDEYFPIKEVETCIPTTCVIENNHIQSIHMTCRRALRTIILSQSDERIRAKECLENKYGRKFMQKFQSSISDFLQKFKACLPIPILQQVVNEASCSQPYHNLSVSPVSLLDSLIFKCSQSAPSETLLLSVLDRLWSSDKYSQQSEYVGESQIFNFLCSGSFMSSQASQGGSVVNEIHSQLKRASQNVLNESSDSSPNAQNVLNESSDSSPIANSPSLLKRYKEDANKCCGELTDSVRSSESSKSTRIFRKTCTDGLMSQNERLDNLTNKLSGNVELGEPTVPENTHSHQPMEHMSNDGDSLLEYNHNNGDHEVHNSMSATSNQKTFFFVLTDGMDQTSEKPVKLFVTPKNISMSNVVDVLCEVLETCTSDICSKSHYHPINMLNNPEQSGVREKNLNNPEERESLFEFFNCYSEDEEDPDVSNDQSVNECESLPQTSETNFSHSRRVDNENGTDMAIPVHGHDSQATGQIHYPGQVTEGFEKPSEHQLDLDINNTNLDVIYSRFSPEYASTQVGDVSHDTIDPQENDDDQGKNTANLWHHGCGRTTEPLDLSASIYSALEQVNLEFI